MLVKIDLSDVKILEFNTDQKYVVVKTSSINLNKVCWMCSVKGETLEDFNSNEAIKGKNIFVGPNGGFNS